MQWKKVTLTNRDVASTRHMALQDEFEKVFMAFHAPRLAAMFSCRSETEWTNYECYFSPAAAEIFAAALDRWKASDSDKPSERDLSLLVGHADARDTLLRSSNDGM